ncbi:asparagine synthetase [Platysternon megacephalum]|uniref:Asparagine synthetase n=1 Tax=Platysternon megacephalum TaxID=55544 RepID=A0A4D9EJ75_9SAUR|nr:asparagine synthetase [Platysternon megacephalum]
MGDSVFNEKPALYYVVSGCPDSSSWQQSADMKFRSAVMQRSRLHDQPHQKSGKNDNCCNCAVLFELFCIMVEEKM